MSSRRLDDVNTWVLRCGFMGREFPPHAAGEKNGQSGMKSILCLAEGSSVREGRVRSE